VAGAATIALYKILFSTFPTGPGITGFTRHLEHEWVVLVNLLLLLLGFALLARHFEDSGIPGLLPRWLPDDWHGALVLLVLVFVLSGFLDNIAAAMIGGAMSHTVFRGKLHVAYLAGIVAAANAGGAGSVIGDTTTTMMWIAGIPASEVGEAYIAAGVALLICGIPAAVVQQRHAPIQQDPTAGVRIDWVRLTVVGLVLAAGIAANVLVNTRYHQVADSFPFLGAVVAGMIILAAPVRRPEWSLLGPAFTGSVFLLALVLSASMMPVEQLPAASWQTAFGLGFLSAVFDNIPLTALALNQEGYDWGFLAYAVGFGGSMIWFGSSAGVALTTMYPEGRSVWLWLRHGWYVIVAYIVGFMVLLATLGFHPGSPPR
jgi:Na+/H+ antiporter NhaD/arsenite permease-like protein